MTLNLHRGSSPSQLADALAELLAADPLDVFDRELVITPSPGVERWLTQRLAHRLGAAAGDDGVCAGLSVHTPTSFMSFALGREFDDPWHPDRLAWLVLTVMDDAVHRPGFEALAHHVGADAPTPDEDPWRHRARQSRRYAVARRLAGLFARYADERPALLRAWEAGDDSGVNDDLAWQPRLWRDVVERAAAQGVTESPVQRLDRVLDALRTGNVSDGGPLDLPRRINFFGYTRVPTALLDLLEALAEEREVNLWLPHPSPALWNDVGRLGATSESRTTSESHDAREDETRAVPLRADDDSSDAAQHPLLATLARDVRELEQVVLARRVDDRGETLGDDVPSDEAARTSPPSRLHQLQADIRANRPPSARADVADATSIQVHACHGPARQVDALREILLWLLDEHGGSLQPRDILVMCPDVETYAPLIKAAFASADDTAHHPGRRLRVQLADRGVASTNPLAEVALRLVTLVTSRVTASDILDFAELPAVQQRFGFDTDALDRIARWVRTTGARWGLDGTHRGEYALAGLDANTWAVALDRLALGVVMGDDTDSPASAHLPVDDVGSTDVETASAFVTMLTEITDAARAIRGSSAANPDLPPASFTAGEWFSWLRRHVGALAAPASDATWQLSAFERELSFLEAGSSETSGLRVTDVRLMLEQRWGPRPGRSNFRTGAVSVCTLTPMRSVPHRAVVLLGMDDDTFPRRHVVDGDDALARAPRLGERDPRSEDRQLLLDALLAAQDHVIALYSGFDERDGTRRPPSVPLQEVIAAAAATGAPEVRDAAGRLPARHCFEQVHPLQPYDERNFRPEGPLPGGSYDRTALDGAQALRALHAGEPSNPPTAQLLGGLLPEAEPRDLTLDDLIRFMENPARTFLRERLQAGVVHEEDEVDDALPIEPDALQLWAVGDRMLKRVLSGVPLTRVADEALRRGALPPAPLASKGDGVVRQVESVLRGVPTGGSTSVNVTVPLTLPYRSGDESLPQAERCRRVRLTGIVPAVVGDEVQVVNYGSVNARHLARAWVNLLALAAAHPGRPWRVAVRGKYGSCLLLPPAEPAAVLTEIATLRQDGLRAPLPVPAKTSLAFVEGYLSRWRRGTGDDADAREAAARKARPVWEGSFERSGERDDAWWSRVFEPERPDLERLNFGNVFIDRSQRLWIPLLDQRQELGR